TPSPDDPRHVGRRQHGAAWARRAGENANTRSRCGRLRVLTNEESTETCGAVQRFALRGRPGFAIANSSSLCPLLIIARSQRGVAPRPAQVSDRFFGLRYFGGTLRPLSLLPRGFGPRLAPRLPVMPSTSS